MSVTVRPAVAADVPDILHLVRALAAYENEPEAVHATQESLAAAMFGEGAFVHALMAEVDGRVCGLALWFLTFSTWTGRPGLYLEDLFVEEGARGLGAGRALFRALAAEALARGCARLEWQVLEWNGTAKGFYRSIGATHSTAWEPWRLDGKALRQMAAAAPPPSAADEAR